ncbi:MAG: pantoate--beta-alanine ligase [Xanthobacteraceae bacterium]
MPKPSIIRTVTSLRQAIGRYRKAGDTIALIPTMGALHAGHLALVRLARHKAKRVVVSIFVNPAQFAPHEDFASYPRTLSADLAALSELKIDLIWAPSVGEMYPDGFVTRIEPEGPAKAGLEDAFRPHFFGGVATVVAKLLQQVTPHFAIFGEKDFQQLKVVTTMARDLDMPVTIVGAPTVREKDGLAMSSRNAYLSASERAVAPTLHQVLKECASRIKDGLPIGAALADGRARIERAGFTVDYLEARNARTLTPIAALTDGPVRLLVAAKLGRTRLIDNIKV